MPRNGSGHSAVMNQELSFLGDQANRIEDLDLGDGLRLLLALEVQIGDVDVLLEAGVVDGHGLLPCGLMIVSAVRWPFTVTPWLPGLGVEQCDRLERQR